MQDPLNIAIPLKGVESSLPVFPEADYVVQVSESTVDVNKEKTGLNWNLKLGTTETHTSTDGREVKPDFPFYMSLALQPREDSKDVEAYVRSLCEAVDALFGTTKENRPEMSREVVNSAVGRTCVAQVYIDEWKGRELNKVKRLKKMEG